MKTQYIFRLDDISWDMNYENFCRIRDLFFKYDIKPIIGVIPHNEDTKLKSQVGNYHLTEDEFWPMVKDLQDNHGWSIALHGYDHVYVTNQSGMFKINNRAEFAGLSYQEQYQKIRQGKAIFEQHGLSIDAFMAPAHSLDWNTVDALLANGIDVITDGRTLFPYKRRGMWFIPNVSSWLSPRARGLSTICLHINNFGNLDFLRLESAVSSCKEDIISFQSAVKAAKGGNYNRVGVRIINHISGLAIPLYKLLRPVFLTY